ncbi:alpha/beta hydrolase [Pseudomonas sp. CGJS7]|uniref:alpha/beta hydrolase n=1 Tax=Pseudomonas sp. CGJS7 TaxID=3109348 RepID=UPI00300A3E8D
MHAIARCLSPLLAIASLSACTWHVRENNIVIPRTAPSAELSGLRTQFPQYRIEEARIAAADGAQLYSLRLLRQDAVATVLYFGGNGYTIGKSAGRTAKNYADAPVNLVLVDHRGYGASTGTASLDALLADAVTVYDDLRKDPSLGGLPLIVHGHSLGSFMAGRVAAARTLDGLILESSVTTTEDWTTHLRSRQKWWARMLVRRVAPEGALAGKGNAEVAAGLDEPALFVVGENDDVTPPRFARALFDAAPLPEGRKRLLIVPGRDHLSAADSPDFRAVLAAWVAEKQTAPAAGALPSKPFAPLDERAPSTNHP